MRRAVLLVEPLLAVALFALWCAWVAGPVSSEIPMRSDMPTTNPYAVVIAGAFAAAIAVSRLSPAWSLGIALVALSAQVFGWASRFSQSAWPAYGALFVLAALLAAHSRGRVRRIAVAAAAPTVLLVGALLTVPWFSLSGEWGLINGKPASSSEVWEDFALVVVASAGATALLWRRGSHLRAPEADPDAHPLDHLSPREREIYLRVADGLTNREIADALFIEESTVKTHVGNILAKLELSSRTGVVAHAYRVGILTARAAS